MIKKELEDTLKILKEQKDKLLLVLNGMEDLVSNFESVITEEGRRNK